MQANIELIPNYMIGGIIRYVEHGIEPGDFLTAIFGNDFVEATGRADEENQPSLHHYAALLYRLPIHCWGSKLQVEHWSLARQKEPWRCDRWPDSWAMEVDQNRKGTALEVVPT